MRKITCEMFKYVSLILVPNVKKTSYNLWKLGQSKEKSKFAKEIEKDITLLVRCNQDGYMVIIIFFYSFNLTH